MRHAHCSIIHDSVQEYNKRGINTFVDIMITSESTRFDCFYSEPNNISHVMLSTLSLSLSLSPFLSIIYYNINIYVSDNFIK